MIKTLAYKPGALLAYAEYGDPNGFPVLVQHGMIASIRDGDLFHTLASRGARVICAARPGYGESSPEVMGNVAAWGSIVAALVEELGLARFDVLGISSGAPYSYAIAQAMPGQVRQVFILSGTPALYDADVLTLWPYPVERDATLPELQALALELFFAHLPPEAQAQADVQDSLRNDCFGIALDLRIRCRAWGFTLAQVQAPVVMRHSRADDSVPLATAQRTAALLPHCRLQVTGHDPHFSPRVLDAFLAEISMNSWEKSVIRPSSRKFRSL